MRLPTHILPRRKQRARDNQGGCSGEREGWLGKAGENKDERRENGGGIGCDAQKTDIAVLDAMIPDIKGGTDGAEAETKDGEPLRQTIGPDGCFEQGVCKE